MSPGIQSGDNWLIEDGKTFIDQRQINKIFLSQVSDCSNQIDTGALNNLILETGANTVQLLILN
jgi:hypothetical protein